MKLVSPDWSGIMPPIPHPKTEADFLRALSKRNDGAGNYDTHDHTDKNKQGNLGELSVHKGISTGGIVAIVSTLHL